MIRREIESAIARPGLARRPARVLEREEREDWDDGAVVQWMTSPFPFGRKPLVPSSAHRTARVHGVDLDDLIGTQRRVTEHGVDKYAIGSGPPGGPAGLPRSSDLPIVYRTPDGRFYIADGHHRLTAALLRGDRRARVRIVDAPE